MEINEKEFNISFYNEKDEVPITSLYRDEEKTCVLRFTQKPPMEINELRLTLKNKQKEISFYESDHSYFYKGNPFNSVSHFIEKYSHKFDPSGKILERCAKREGITKEEMQAQWDKKKNDGCEKGTRIHLEHEHMLWGIEQASPVIRDLFADGLTMLDTEVIFFNEELKLAGQTDALLYDRTTKSVVMIDWKTNRRIDLDNKYNKFMLEPFQKLSDDSMGHYTLQLNLYKYMCEKWGIPIKKMILIHLKDNDNYKLIDIEDIESFSEIMEEMKNER